MYPHVPEGCTELLDCTTTRDRLKMASNTESDLENEVEDVTEEVGQDVIIVESVNAKGKSKESAV